MRPEIVSQCELHTESLAEPRLWSALVQARVELTGTVCIRSANLRAILSDFPPSSREQKCKNQAFSVGEEDRERQCAQARETLKAEITIFESGRSAELRLGMSFLERQIPN
jgi:hypothetical protein